MDPDHAKALRLEARALVTAAGTRRHLPTTVHVGEPRCEDIGGLLAEVEPVGP